MPILDLQRRMHQIGRIRIGQQVATSGGKTRPAKLSTFRFTSQDDVAVKAAAELFGGEARPWDGAPTGEQWEVISEANVIAVVVPPAATAFSQWYEQWSGGGCIRRCDGQTELITESPCLCAVEDERVCTPHTRLNVILRDLPGIGVWRLDTSGWYAATELAGTVEVIMNAATRGQLLPAVLRLEERQVKRPGEAVKKFAVPVLDIQVTPTALGLVVGSAAPALPPVGPAEATWTPIATPATPEPETDVGDAIRQAGSDGPKRRKNSPPELPPTGLNPRGAPTEPSAEVLSQEQMNHLRALYTKVGFTDRAAQKAATAVLLGVDRIDTHSTLTPGQASKLIDTLIAVEAGFVEFVCDDQGTVTGVRDALPEGEAS